MKRHSAFAICAAGALLALVPSTAAGTTRHAAPAGGTTGPCTLAVPCSFDFAVSIAAAGDTVSVKPGVHNSFASPVIAAPNVEVLGEPGGATPVVNLNGVFPVAQGIAFGATAGGGKVSGLVLNAASGATAVTAYAPITVSDVEITSSGTCVALNAPGSTVADSEMTQTAGGFGFTSCLAEGFAGGNATIRNVEITASTTLPGIPAVTLNGPGTSVDRLVLSGTSGVAVGHPAVPGAATTLRRSRIDVNTAGTFGTVPALSVGPSGIISDTLVTASGTAASAIVASGGKLRNVTALAEGTGARGLAVLATSSPALVSVKNSIFRASTAASDVVLDPGAPSPFLPGDPICTGVPTPSYCLPTVEGNLTIDHSNFRAVTGTLNAASGSNQVADPQFINAAGGDYKLVSGSPAIDAGVDDADNGTTDLAGKARKLGAAVDIGAYEFEPPATTASPGPSTDPTTPSGNTEGGAQQPEVIVPIADSTRPALSRVGITNKVFAVGSARTTVARRAKKGTTVVYTLSETARVAVAIERPVAGRRKGRSCVKPTKKNRKAKKCTRYTRVGAVSGGAGIAGANALPFSGRIGRKALKPGTYRASLIAVDAAGNKSTAKSVGFKVVRR